MKLIFETKKARFGVEFLRKTRFAFVLCVAAILLSLALPVESDAAQAIVRRDAFLSQLLSARGFETQNKASANALFILKSGIVTDTVDKLEQAVTRQDALRWMIQALGLSEEAKILSNPSVNSSSLKLPFNDVKPLSDFERGCLLVATLMKPPLFKNSAAVFGHSHKISPDEAKVLISNVRRASEAMKLELSFPIASGMNMEIYREGTFSGIPKWRVYVDGFDEREEVISLQKHFASKGFKMKESNPNYEWRLGSELFEDYADAKRVAAIAKSKGKSSRIFASLMNENLENQPFYWALLTIDPARFVMEPIMPIEGISVLSPLSVISKGAGVSAAINAGFFALTARNRGYPIGILKRYDLLLSKPYAGRTCLGWRQDNRAMFGKPDVYENNSQPWWNDMENVIQAGPYLIHNGEIGIEPEGYDKSILNLRHPRTAVGLTKSGQWAFFVGDGRDSMHSAGYTLLEMAVILKRKGLAYALNLDGGGSSEILVNGRLFNAPSEKRERPVSYGIGVKVR
ncbi:hypothetical protein AGMMS50276_20000 [Synergistales bacterium]|nr:hypothetical protein AGMMS50276_20000 [Synergistales bacterium]